MSEATINTVVSGDNSGGTPSQSGGAAGGASGTAGANINATDWTAGLSEELKGYVQNKGFKDPAAIVDSYRNFEKLYGVPKERLLKLPEKDDDPSWGEVYAKLGRPEKAEAYKLDLPPEIGDENFAKAAQAKFHELGLSTKQGEKLAAWWNEQATGGMKAQQEAAKAQLVSQDNALKQEWGQAYDQNINVAKRAASAFGMDEKTIDSLEAAMGFAGVMKFMHNLGSKLGEDKYVSGNAQGNNFGVLTPAAAKERINALKNDSDFRNRYSMGDAKAKEEMDRLHMWAYSQ